MHSKENGANETIETNELPERKIEQDIFPAYEPEQELDDKWYGVPAKGEVPLPRRFLIFEGKWAYVAMIIGVIILEICIWAVYRWSTAELFESFGTYQFYLFHIIAAPTIHLLPIILFWWYIRNERGLPFVFTKKLLLSGIIVGFVAAIIWRLLEEFIYNGVAGMAGGIVPDTFTFLNVLESADLFILMTFVMYFIVGPVEELEFRGFLHDQAARALPNWQALIVSSVLFGCSHIPIALFVYQFTGTQFVDALFGWIAAGFTFGALYMWSRNIFACIVMHGMGNWQLSVFYFQSAPAGMEPTTAMWVGITTSFISNAVMIVIFYMIHKYYWQPHRRGEPAFGGIFLSIQNYIHDHDFERKPVVSTITVAVLFIFIVSGIILGATVSMGVIPPPAAEAAGGGARDIENWVVSEEVITGSSHLEEPNNESITTLLWEDEKYIKSVIVTISWTDEADIRLRYKNQPDTFELSIDGPIYSDEARGPNTQGSQGSISAQISYTNEETAQIFADLESPQINITAELLEAGNQETNLGFTYYEDSGNDYTYEIIVEWLVPEV